MNSSEEKLYNALESARQGLEKHVREGRPFNFCWRFAFDALKDETVQKAFVKHISSDEDFRELTCHGFGIDSVEIVFRFQCRLPKICLIPPAFAVQYDIVSKSVIKIIDPYIGPPGPV